MVNSSVLAYADRSQQPTSRSDAPATRTVHHLKILHYEGDSVIPISTLPAPWATDAEKAKVKLGDLRKDLKIFVKFNYGFCLQDKSYVPDDTDIQAYFQHSARKQPAVEEEVDEKQAAGTEMTDDKVLKGAFDNTIYIKTQAGKPNAGVVGQGEFILKVIDKTSEGEEHGSIHSSQLSGSSQPFTLGTLRPHLKITNVDATALDFCFEDKTIAHDSILLEKYLGKALPTKEADSELPVIPLYVRQIPRSKAEVLKGNYMIRFVKKADAGSEDGNDTTQGSVQSYMLGAANTLCLYHLRGHVQGMSADSKRHEFCMADGTSMSDGTRLETYLNTASDSEEAKSSTPVFTVFFKKVASKPWFGGASEEMKADTKVDIKPDLKFGGGVDNAITGDQLRQKAADMSDSGISDEFLTSLEVQLPNKIVYPSQLDESQWANVLRNCNVFYGWKFDLATLAVRQAPYAAFKLRKGLNMPSSQEAVWIEEPALPKPFSPSKPNRSEIPTTSGESQDNKELSTPSESTGSSPRTYESGTLVPAEIGSREKKEESEGEAEEEDEEEDEEEETLPPPMPPIIKADAMPTFKVSDDSRVDVSVIDSRLQESMARNNFTADSFEVGAAGSIKGVDIGVSGGKAERKEESQGKVTTTTDRVMVANYRFPRVQLLLRPGDLEPTEELIAAIQEVKKSKSLDRLRALHDNFGHLFCGDVILGGCLQTTRVTRGYDNLTETAMKSQFKAEVGAAISAPRIGSLNMKYSKEKGSDESQSSQQTHVSDSMVFEATGGNTVLATNPPKWILSILEPQNWRVIERGSMLPLTNVLAACSMEEVRGVHKWFLQAVPTLSQFIKVPSSRSLPVRFRVMPQIPGQAVLFPDLTKSFYLGHQDKKPVHPIRVALEKRTTEFRETQQQRQVEGGGGGNIVTDLAGAILPFHPLTRLAGAATNLLPSGRTVIDITREWVEKKTTTEVALFTPARAQGPVLLQYNDAIKTSSISLATHDESIWDMLVPEDDIVKDNTKVMLRSRTGGSAQNRWLTVYRTFQGSFMPGITSDQGGSIWRLVRDTTMRPNATDGYFQEGDLVRLTWTFADQTAGFRNFQLDAFGRRCYQKPIDVRAPTLHLKVPYPGFGYTTRVDSSDTSGQAMIMSDEPSQLPYVTTVVVKGIVPEVPLQHLKYNLHDLSFRLDVVGNEGRGELYDYMTSDLSQSEEETHQQELSRRTEQSRINVPQNEDSLGSAFDGIGRAIIPGYDLVAGPAKSIVRGFCGLFGL